MLNTVFQTIIKTIIKTSPSTFPRRWPVPIPPVRRVQLDNRAFKYFYHNWTNSILQQMKRKFCKISDPLFRISSMTNSQVNPPVRSRSGDPDRPGGVTGHRTGPVFFTPPPTGDRTGLGFFLTPPPPVTGPDRGGSPVAYFFNSGGRYGLSKTRGLGKSFRRDLHMVWF